MERIDFLSK